MPALVAEADGLVVRSCSVESGTGLTGSSTSGVGAAGSRRELLAAQ
jgi:hypothetical protein